MKVLLLTLCTAISLLAFSAPAPVAPTALLVVGNTNLNIGDLAMKNRLQLLGYTVTVKGASASAAGDASGKNLIIISSTVASGDVTTKFTNVAVPLINCENALFDDLEMTGTGSSHFGNQTGLTQIKIVNAAHPLAAGLANGNVVVMTTFDGLSWGAPSANAIKIASLTGDAEKFPVFGYEAGVLMDGFVAPARRLGFFTDDDGATLLTPAGLQLLDAAITWTANVSVTVQNTPPVIHIIAPVTGTTFIPGDDVTISVNASDADGSISQVKFFNGNDLISTVASSPYSCTLQQVSAGNYSITARAYDNNNDSASTATNIIVELPNAAPTVAITSPVDGAAFIAPAEILITADAGDSDGNVVKVEFFSGNTFLGVDSTSDYSFTLSNVAGGNYTFTTKATDNLGKTTTSAPVNVHVEDTSYVPPHAPKNALFIVGSSTLNPSDLALKNKLIALGFDVTVKSGSVSATADAIGQNLVFISSTVSAADVDDKFLNSTTPFIICESGLFSEMKMTGGSGNYGSQSSENEAVITNAAHPLAAGLTGTVVVYTKNETITWGKPVTSAIVAMLPGSSSKASVFAYDAGATMQGFVAPARRVGFFLNDNGAAFLSAQGNQLLDAAIMWAANVSAPSVPNVAPAISITAPANGASFAAGDNILISANASDTDGSIVQVKFFQGSTLLSTDVTSPYSFTWPSVAAGNYSITARAYDNKNDSASVSVNVTVVTGNLAPVASITEPTTGTNFIAPAAITINATASDNDGSIVKVEFYAGNILLGVDSTNDYSFTFTNVSAGSYGLRVIATDNEGLTAASAVINVTVEDTTHVPPPPVQKNALFIVGNTTLSSSDLAVKTRLESLGFTVTAKTGSASAASDAVGKNIVVISSSNSADDLDDKFLNSTTPLVVCESGIFSDMKMTGGSGNYGTQSSEDEVIVTNSAHPLAAGLSGTMKVYTKNEVITWGKPVTSAIVAMLPGSSSKAAIFAYDAGATMQGIAAPARRVGFFLNDNGAAFLTADGWKFFDAAINWAANTAVTPPTANTPPAVSLSAPSNNASFTSPATITLSANASDSDGSVTKVEFYEGNNLLGSDLTSPYSFAWNNVAAGSYVLKAKATDNSGATMLSASVNISVEQDNSGEPSNLPFTVSITSPANNASFLEGTSIALKASITGTGAQQQTPYLKVVNSTANSYRKMKLAYDDGAIYGPNRNVIAGGNNKLEITLRDFTGTAQWSKIQIKPNSSSNAPSSLQTYVTAAGGIANEWKTISIPLSDFSGFDFTKVTYLEFPSCKGANAFEIGIQKIVFTGGSTPFLWFGDGKTNNNHDGKGDAGQLLATLVAAEQVSVDKVEFYRGNSLLNTDSSSPFEFTWNNAPSGSHTLTARAYQGSQFVVSSPLQVSVDGAIGDTIKVVVTFNSTPSSYSVQKAALKYNKDFAYSYTQDDGSDDGYRIVYPMFKGGLSDFNNVTYPGMFYTDGCGNNIPFKAGLAIHSKNSLGQDLHTSRSVDGRITWDELKEVHAAGWDVLNHSLTHAANGTNTPFVYQITENVAYVKLKTGIDMTHFAVPSGDERYVEPAFDNGMVAVYDQSGSGFYSSATQVDAALNLNRFKLKRHFIQNSTDNISNVSDAIDEAASLSVNGKHYWYNDATHNVSSDYGGTLKYDVFAHYMNHVHSAYGKDGMDNMWMAPLQEVYEYMAVKQATLLSSQLYGNKLEITLLLNNVPDKLRRYALTLNITSNVDFNSVTVNGTSNYCFKGTGSKKLINLDWTASHTNKIFKTAPEAEEVRSQISPESETFEMSISPNPAQDVLVVNFATPESRRINITVFDMLGKIVMSSSEQLQEGNSRFLFDLSKNNSGFYFIKVWSADGVERIEKFVKR